MADTLTLAVDGQVSLKAFSDAMAGLESLVAALASEVGGEHPESRVQWVVDSLYTSSAVATIRGIGPASQVDQVVRAYESTGEAIRDDTVEELPPRVRSASKTFLRLIQGGTVPSIRFETEYREVIVRPRGHLQLVRESPAIPTVALQPAIGAVTGRVETLSHRGGLRFTLFDELHDKAVSCYLRPGYEETMRDIWGHRAEVVGLVSRDPETGRPIAVRNVTRVSLIADEEHEAWRRAMGIAPAANTISAEEAIRLVRDAW